MNRKQSRSAVTRRTFIRTAGLAAVAAAFPKTTLSTLTSRALKIEVLLSPSSIYPEMGNNFIAGMKLYDAQADSQTAHNPMAFEFKTIGLGFGSAAEASNRLIKSDGVDMVVGMVGSNMAAQLRPIFEQHQTMLVAVNTGANVVRADEISPYILHHSLNLWQSNWALGHWAATHLGTRAAMTMSFYDSGYDAPYLFQLGFEQAGGTIVQSQVSRRPGDSGHLASLMDEIKTAQPDFVYASYCGSEAVQFLQAYADAGLAGQIPLVGSSYLVDRAVLAQSGSAGLGVKTVSSWAESLPTAENDTFMTDYQTMTGSPADTFAVLGYDTAQLIATVAVNRGTLRKIDEVQKALENMGAVGPRGQWGVNCSTMHCTGHSLYLREVQRHGSSLDNAAVATLAPFIEDDMRVQVATSSPKTGWSHPYLSL